jgi:hypothetical protein
MADLVVTIGGQPAAYRAGTLSISGSLGTRTTASLQTVDHPPFTSVVEVGQVVEIRDETGSLIFAGTVDSVEEEIDASKRLRVKRLACVDYTQIADRHLVAYVYKPDEEHPTVSAGDVIKDIVARFFVYGGVSEGIDTSPVEDGPAIEKLVFNYIPASQAFDDIAELAGYIWYIDYEKRLHFTPKDRNTAPFGLTETSQNWRNLKITESRELYRNRQIVRAGTALTDERTDTVIAVEADQKLFELSYPVGTASAVTVGGVAKTLGVSGLHEGRDYLLVLRVERPDGRGRARGRGRSRLTYQGLFPILVDERIDAEILARRALEGGTGVYEAIADDPAINVQTVAVQKGVGLPRKHGVIPQTIRFETDCPGLRPGQLLPVDIPAAGLGDNYLVESVNMRDVQGRDQPVSVSAVSGDALGGWLEWFSALARQAQKFVLYDEDQVSMLREITDTVRVYDISMEYQLGTVDRIPESRVENACVGFSETDWVH